MRTYGKAITLCTAAIVSVSVIALNAYYLLLATPYSPGLFARATLWGALVGTVTSTLAALGALPVAGRLPARGGRRSFVLLGALAVLVGWLVLGVLNGLGAGWGSFFGFPLIALGSAVLTAGASIMALRLVMPRERDPRRR